MIDQLIVSMSIVSQQLLPILGAAVLIFLILFLRRGIEFVNECTKRVKQLETTVQGVDQSIEKMQAPLDTVVKVSNSVNRVHDSTEAAVKQAVSFVASNLGSVSSKIHSEPVKTDEEAEPEIQKEEKSQMTEGEDLNVRE